MSRENRYLALGAASLALGLVLTAFLSATAKADSIVTTVASWHASNHNRGPKDSNYNEANFGLGYEYTVNQNSTIAFGYYTNSFDRHSNYIAWMYQPYHWDVASGDLKFGFLAGNITGYPKTNDWVTTEGVDIHTVQNRTFNPMFIPVLSYQRGPLGFNLEIMPIPPFNQRSILGLQLKVALP